MTEKRSSARPSPVLRYPGPVLRVRVLERPNRFLAIVEDAERGRLEAHVPNPGRLRELIPPQGTVGHVIPAAPRSEGGRPPRRTLWTLVNVASPNDAHALVSVDTGAASPLVARALEQRCLPPFHGWGTWEREVVWGHHRFDHAVREGGGARPRALLEVKSSNLREGEIALFPDAPTSRGTSHVLALSQFARRGGKAALLFVVQRDDIRAVAPYGAMDPEFARAVESARRAGVVVRGRTLHVRSDGARWGDEVPVLPPRWEGASDLPPPSPHDP